MNNPDQDTLIRVVDGFWRVCCYCPGNLVLDAREGLARSSPGSRSHGLQSPKYELAINLKTAS
jgi:hypothetical protein